MTENQRYRHGHGYGCGPNMKWAHFRPFMKGMMREFANQQDFVSYDYDEENEVYTAEVDLAGVSKENIKIKAAKYSVKLEIKTDDADKPTRRKLRFRRQIDPTKVTAKYNNGQLTISVPVAEKTQYSDVNVD